MVIEHEHNVIRVTNGLGDVLGGWGFCRAGR